MFSHNLTYNYKEGMHKQSGYKIRKKNQGRGHKTDAEIERHYGGQEING